MDALRPRLDGSNDVSMPHPTFGAELHRNPATRFHRLDTGDNLVHRANKCSRDTVDLTIDSDDESLPRPLFPPRSLKKTPVPIPTNGQHANRPRQTPVPLPLRATQNASPAPLLFKSAGKVHSTSPVPLPANVRHLEGPPSSVSTHAPFRNSPTPYISPYSAKEYSNGHGALISNDEASKGHASVQSLDVLDNHQQTVKRRKLSGPGTSHSGIAHIPVQDGKPATRQESGSSFPYQATGFGILRAIPSANQYDYTTSTSKATRQRPSIQTLNSMMKSKEKTHSGPEDLLSAKARPLSIHKTATTMSKRFLDPAPTEDKLVPAQTFYLPPKSAMHNGTIPLPLANADNPEDAATMIETFRHRVAPISRPTATSIQPSGNMHQAIPMPSNGASNYEGGTAPAENLQPSFKNSTVAELVPGDDHQKTQARPTSSFKTAIPPSLTSTPLGARFTEQEDHLLIYLKEVQGAGWKEISQHFPSRKTYNLQSRYSHYLNKRNKSKDPSQWNLPAWFNAQAAIQPQGQIQAVDVPIIRPCHGRPPRDLSTRNPVPRILSTQLASSSPKQDFTNDDPSSANEHLSHQTTKRPRGRPRRNVQQVDYALLRRTHTSHGEEEPMDLDSSSEDGNQQRFNDLSKAPSVALENIIPLETPVDIDYEQEDAIIALDNGHGQHLPYLSSEERLVMQRGSARGEWEQRSGRIWQGTIIHVDFNDDELILAEKAIQRFFRLSLRSMKHQKIRKLLSDQPEHQLLKLSYELRKYLPRRTQESIDAFLSDARTNRPLTGPSIKRIGAVRPNKTFSSKTKDSMPSLVRNRELGLQSRRGWKTNQKAISYQMRNYLADSLGPTYSYKGASSDVHTVAWHPSGLIFAAGSVCVTDPDSMQYNRPNNLLYGDLTKGNLHEIAEHRECRSKTETGPNSTDAMHASQDPFLYSTVSMVAFSPNGKYLFSAGYDKYADIWRIPESPSDGGQPELVKRLKHKAEVDILTVSCQGKVATAAKKTKSNAVKLITVDEFENVGKHSFTSRKASERPDMNILPTALQFEPNAGRLLLAGFGANKREDGMDVNGDICLWDVETLQELHVYGSTRNVFDVAFNPCQRTQPLFAVGCVGGTNVNRGIHSVVRFYDTRDFVKYTSWIELECPALDMNEVIYCPYDENIVAAGCTSGSTYVWDIRNPDTWLYRLSHGTSSMPLYDHLNREVTDTGVRFLSWGDNATRLYTGSSDGVVKVWDVVRSPDEVFVKDLISLDSGIMSGSFSPDFSKLLLGEVDGSINVLETGRDDCLVKDAAKFRYVPYVEEQYDEADIEVLNPANSGLPESGRAVASEMLRKGEIQHAQFGGFPIRQAIQGPNYNGPFDVSIEAPFLRQQALEFQLNLARSQGPECSIPACKDTVVTTTVEEAGDSGRSIDRIPDELRKQWQLVGSALAVVPGKSQCSQCGRQARPLESSVTIDQPILCERCLFACFRCGAPNKIRPETKVLACHRCKRIWDIGAIGYECVKDSGFILKTNGVPKFRHFDEELYLSSANGEADATYGDQLNALTDHYLSLAIDRPVSPAL